MQQTEEAPASRFERLVEFLREDPDNLRLINYASFAALDENRPADAANMVERYAQLAALPPTLVNVLGLAALAEGRDEDARTIFQSLLAKSPDDPELRFNLAWALGRQGNHQGALELAGMATPASAALTVRSLHHLGRLEEAITVGDAWEASEGSADLWGALASVAIDLEDMERAVRWAQKGQESPEGKATLGLLALGEGDAREAQDLFEGALTLKPDLARAQLGLGSVLLSEGRSAQAATLFDKAAETFGDHPGSWLAAGWAWLIAGDAVAARQRFERARAIDDTFGETQGSLAVLAALEGDHHNAARLAETARRLDGDGLGGALARMLILDREGDAAAATDVRNAALNVPVAPGGVSVQRMLARLAAKRR
jgi:tetratricopeptide (TPR) repeat protein